MGTKTAQAADLILSFVLTNIQRIGQSSAQKAT
jgi:hypothetical protein